MLLREGPWVQLDSQQQLLNFLICFRAAMKPAMRVQMVMMSKAVVEEFESMLKMTKQQTLNLTTAPAQEPQDSANQ